jgi:hypothetical protein
VGWNVAPRSILPGATAWTGPGRRDESCISARASGVDLSWYRKAGRRGKASILDGLCAATGYHRKYAISLLAHPPELKARRRRARSPRYSPEVIRVLSKIWEAAGSLVGASEGLAAPVAGLGSCAAEDLA